MSDSMYPAGVTDNDSYFNDDPNGLDCDEDNCDEESNVIKCSKCGKPTTFDPTYGDLCYRCCRASNE